MKEMKVETKNHYYEKHYRTIFKTLTYRLIIICSVALITYVSTKDITLTLTITIGTNILNTIIYYLHERIWNNIHWGIIKK